MPIEMLSEARKRKENGQRGVALIITLLLLILLVALTLAMVISTSSDTLINHYYRNFRSSFYAADSGANIARQYMSSQLAAAAITAGTNFSSTGTPPLQSSDAATALSNTLTQFANPTTILAGSAVNSWPSNFQIVASQSGTVGTTLSTTPTCQPIFNAPNAGTGTVSPAAGPYNCTTSYPTCTGACTGFGITDFVYTFPYTITAIGHSQANEQQMVEDEGNITLNVHVAAATGSTTNFAAYGMFIDQNPICDGSYLVAGTISGPAFTNGAWTFGNSGSYTFTGKVGSVSPQFGWQGGSCTQSGTYPQAGFSTTFQSSVSLGATAVPLPGNDFNQKEAVVDTVGNLGSISNAQMNAALKEYNGTAYPAAGTSNPGVYMGYSTTVVSGVTTHTMTGGGIYVEGSANSVVLSTANPTISGTVHNQQLFTIVQGTGSSAVTTTITVDLTSNTTTMASKTGSGSTTTTTIVGVPENDSSGTPTEGTMLYVDGTIDSLSGPSSGAAIQNGSAVTVDAGNAGDIDITGNITYATEPVTLTQNQIPGTPADTLIPGNNNGQVLGLFTAGGNVNLEVPTSGQNLEIDASIATIVSGGSGGLVNPGNAINTLTIVGGRIQNTIQNINTTTRNVWFDQRFAQGGFSPPWFPSTTITPAATDSVTSVIPSAQRTQWLSLD